MDTLRRKFGKRLKHLRLRANHTQETLAEEANLSVDFISLVERGINAPSFESIEKLAKALNVEVYQLFFFPDDSQGNPPCDAT